MDVLVLYKYLNDYLEGKDIAMDSLNEDGPQMKSKKLQEKKSKVTDMDHKDVINIEEGNNDDNDTSLVNIMEGIKKSKGIKESTINIKSMINKSLYKHHKMSPQKEKFKVMNQNDQMERNTERRFRKRKLIVTSDFETNAQAGVQDIITSVKKKNGGKKILANVVATPLDNVSFRSESRVERWKYVVQRRMEYEREPGEDAQECKELVNLIKAIGLWNIVAEVSPYFEKLVREFIVNLSCECNSEGSEEFGKVYVRGEVCQVLY